MTFSFHPAADIEFFDAIEYFEECEEGLGLDFSREIFSAIDRIIRFPEAWTLISEDRRRCLVRRFPYSIIYEVNDNEIFILVVMQQNREPDYWKNRLIG